MENYSEIEGFSQSCFFLMDSTFGRILTVDNLRKRGREEQGCQIGAICVNEVGETMVHLLLYCPLANELWTMVFGLVFIGLCGGEFQICQLIGRVGLITIITQPFRKQCLIVKSGVFGGSETLEVLSDVKGLLLILSYFYSNLCLIGLQLWAHFLLILFQI